MTEEQRDLDDIVRVSRALGSDPAFVLHGGGNTSIKTVGADVTGAMIELLLVKGSGWDLATIEGPGFARLRRDRLHQLLQLPVLDDASMVNELRQAALDADSPTASIEALLHAHLPARVVLHSHADAIVALTDRDVVEGEVAAALGHGVLVLPYVKPGFELARLVADSDLTGIDAIVLSKHGLFTFADDSDAALERHRSLVARAAAALGVDRWGERGSRRGRAGAVADVVSLRSAISRAAGRPLLLQQIDSERAASFCSRPDLLEAASRGTATPEHVIYTKRTPLVGRDVAAYSAAYREYFSRHRDRAERSVTELDPAPRVVLDPVLGLLAAGETARDVSVVSDIVLHTMDVVDAADGRGGFQSLSESESFDIEYWTLEQAKLAKRRRLPLSGEVALVTGAASGIGRAVANALLASGASVVGIDIAEEWELDGSHESWRAVSGDVRDPEVIDSAVELASRDFGGIDIVVAAAGIFPPSAPIAQLQDEVWDRALAINATAVARLFRAAHPALAVAPRGGRAVLISTKNVAAPGPGAAAYSASKAAAAQFARVAALEWAEDGIRVNQVAPDAVFDTAIWTPELLRARAEQYGLSEAEYRTRNLLQLEVTSAMVADAVLSCCQGMNATTGAVISVDGGNDRVI